MRRKTLTSTFLLAGLTVSLSACGTSDNAGDSGEETFTLTIANVTGPETSSGSALEEFATAVEEETDGRVQVTLHQSGTLGGETETLEQLQSGSINGMLAQAISLMQSQAPALAVEELPFLFPSQEAAYQAVDGEFGELVSQELRSIGLEPLAYWENGYRHFTNNTTPIETPEDMEGLQFRSAESEIRISMFESLGASAIPMPFPEVYTGLEQGTIDGQENPLNTFASAGFQEVQEYLTLSGHIWSAAPLFVSADWWETVPEDLQEIISEQAMEYRLVNRERVQESDEELLAELEEAGMTINEVDTSLFQEATKEVWDEWEDAIGPEFMDLAEEIRDSE